jgi:hypothetical protein
MGWVTCVQARPNQRLYVELQDGRSGEIDLSSDWGELQQLQIELRNPALFAQVTVSELGEVTWPNGASLTPERIERMLSGEE